ncbi:MAG: DMT family transporter [Pseudomonadota bacterium]
MSQSLFPSSSSSKNRVVRRAVPWLVLFGIGIAWGAAAPLAKFAVSSGHHPIAAAFWNIATAAILVTLARCVFPSGLRLSWPTLRFFFVCGFLGRALPITLAYEAFARLPVGLVVLLLATTPLMTLFISAFMRAETLAGGKVIGLFLGFAAIVLVIVGSSGVNSINSPIILMLPVLIALSYAAEGTFIKTHKPPTMSTLTAVFGTTWSALILLLPLALLHGAWSVLREPGLVEAAIAGGAFLHLCGYFGFVWLIGRAGPAFSSQVGYLVTATGVVTGMVFYDEHLTPAVWLAAALLGAGLMIVKPNR